jgi:hypothetical protein
VVSGFPLKTIDFNSVEFLPRVTVSQRTKNPDGSIELDVNGSSLSIRPKMAHLLLVVPVRYVRVLAKSPIR